MNSITRDGWAIRVTNGLYVRRHDSVRDGIVSVDGPGPDVLFDRYCDAEVVVEEILKISNLNPHWDVRIVQANCTVSIADEANWSDYEITYKHRYQTKQRKMVIPRCPTPTCAISALKQIMATRRYSLGSIVEIKAL